MDFLEIVTKTAADLGYIDSTGALQPLDSVSVIDLVTALEEACDLKFPMPELRQEHFVSVETIAALVSETAAMKAKKKAKKAS
jgi:acyl carrier protein